ncbi:hypothetical protein [Microviridae sp.]|nr:hypothetical protein [Microviridae sp.]
MDTNSPTQKPNSETSHMLEKDRFVVANFSKIPCTVRTLRPFLSAGPNPWVHSGELMDALLYLAARSGLPDDSIRALKELLEELSYSLKTGSVSQDHLPEENTATEGPPNHNTPAVD